MKYRTFEEIQNYCPIGAVYDYHRTQVRRSYTKNWQPIYNEYLRNGMEPIVISNENNCLVLSILYPIYVKGYLYDGEFWYVAEPTHDRWEPVAAERFNTMAAEAFN